MKKNITYHLFLTVFIFLVGGSTLFGQNYTEDMRKIVDAFKSKDISFHMKYRFYPYDSLNIVSDSISAYCCLSGQNYYCKITAGGALYEYIKNTTYFFIVDHSLSAIAVNKSSASPHELWDINKVDSMVHSPGVKVSYKNIGKNEGEYTITMSGTMWNKLKLTFNKSNYALESMFMYSSARGKLVGTDYSKPRIGILYSSYSNNLIDKNIFSEDKFFHYTPGVIVLTDTYKKYKLLDYIHKLPKRS